MSEFTPGLRLERFCGSSTYEVKQVSVYVSEPRRGQEGGVLLSLDVKFGVATHETSPEGERIGWSEPLVEVWLPVPEATLEALDGLQVSVPWKYFAPRDARHRLYVFEHESLWNLEARFHVTPRHIELTLTGTARDPNHYDGSKPETKLTMCVAFKLDA